MLKLKFGDCLQRMRDIPDGSVDLVVTSPPYDNLRTYNGSLEWSFEIFQGIAQQLYRVLTQGGVIVWVVADATVKGSETGSSFRQALYFKELGLNLHDTMIWQKQTFTDTGSLRVRYGGVFEYMFILAKGRPAAFNPIKDRQNKTAGSKIHGTVRLPDGSTKPMSNIGKTLSEKGQRFNIWQINTEVSNARCHPAQFPEQLAHDHILSWSNEGDTILDPFMGSGTTGVACVNTGRSFIGIEKDETYFRISVERIKAAKDAKRMV